MNAGNLPERKQSEPFCHETWEKSVSLFPFIVPFIIFFCPNYSIFCTFYCPLHCPFYSILLSHLFHMLSLLFHFIVSFIPFSVPFVTIFCPSKRRANGKKLFRQTVDKLYYSAQKKEDNFKQVIATPVNWHISTYTITHFYTI